MNAAANLNGIERRAWLRIFEDGLWDLAIGLTLIGFGLPVLFDLPQLAGGTWIVVFSLFRAAKRWITEPRIGRVAFTARRTAQQGRVRILLGVLVLIGVAAFAFIPWLIAQDPPPAWAEFIGVHFVLVLALVWGGALALAGWLADFRRLIAHGVILAASLVVSDLTEGYTLGWAFIAAGVLIGISGLFLLVRFVTRYPRVEAPKDGEDA